jgi:hypothetical protein
MALLHHPGVSDVTLAPEDLAQFVDVPNDCLIPHVLDEGHLIAYAVAAGGEY